MSEIASAISKLCDTVNDLRNENIRLEAENERMRKALERVAFEGDNFPDGTKFRIWARAIARSVLLPEPLPQSQAEPSAQTIDDRESDYVKYGLREEDLP